MIVKPGERGSQTVVALGLVAALVSGGSAAMVTVDLFRWASRVQHQTNLSALAAADVSMGVVIGAPCPVARRIAADGGIRLVECVVNGRTVLVVGQARRNGFVVTKRARAGGVSGGVWQD